MQKLGKLNESESCPHPYLNRLRLCPKTLTSELTDTLLAF